MTKAQQQERIIK